MRMTIEIIDTATGRPPAVEKIDRIAKEYGLMEMDIDQFAVTEDGQIVLLDECGYYSYVDAESFNLKAWFCEDKKQ